MTTTTESMLTTVDNPFDPFDQYDDWFAFDQRHGYNTPSFLARVAVLSDEMSEADQSLAIELAIEEIVRENVTGIHKRVSRTVQVE